MFTYINGDRYVDEETLFKPVTSSKYEKLSPLAQRALAPNSATIQSNSQNGWFFFISSLKDDTPFNQILSMSQKSLTKILKHRHIFKSHC